MPHNILFTAKRMSISVSIHSLTFLFLWQIILSFSSHFQERELKKQREYEEFLKEKLMIDEIVRKIYEEDQRYNLLYSVFQIYQNGNPRTGWVGF